MLVQRPEPLVRLQMRVLEVEWQVRLRREAQEPVVYLEQAQWPRGPQV